MLKLLAKLSEQRDSKLLLLFICTLVLGPSLFLLKADDWLVESMGLKSLIDLYKGYVTLAIIASSSIILLMVLLDLKTNYGTNEERMRLHDLTCDEQVILARFIKEGTRTQWFSTKERAIPVLIAKEILTTAGTTPVGAKEAAFNITIWAKNYLSNRKNWRLIEVPIAKSEIKLLPRNGKKGRIGI